MTAFDYGNARLRAMKARLLTRPALDALAEARGIPSLAAALADTPYRPHIDAALARLSGPGTVFRALLLDLQETVAKITRYYHDEARSIVGIVLRRYDIHNLKAVLRGVSRNAAPEAIAEAWLPPGVLGEPVLRDLAGAGDLRAAVDRLATLRFPLSRPLIDLRAGHPGAGLFEMELALSRWHYRTAAEELTGGRHAALSEDLEWQSDIEDLVTVLRFVSGMRAVGGGGGPSASDLRAVLLGYGSLSIRELVQAASADSVEGAVRSLQRTRYGPALRAGFERFQSSDRLSDIELELRRAHLTRSAGRIRTDPLGIGVPLGYLALKSSEIANLRWIIRGVGSGLPAAEIKAGIQ
jgi:V/A-type H+-transporting ATPase subunit C